MMHALRSCSGFLFPRKSHPPAAGSLPGLIQAAPTQPKVPTCGARACFCLALLVCLGCSPQHQASRHLERAHRFYQSDLFQEAEIEYKNVLRLIPEQPEAAGRLGVIYQSQGRYLFALVLLQKAKELQPDNLEWRIPLGTVYAAGRKLKQAKGEALFVLQRDPGHEQASLLLAQSMLALKDAAGLAQHLEQVRAQAENSAGFLLAQGVLQRANNNPSEAESSLRRALQAAPQSPFVHAELGNLLWSQGNLREAERSLQAAARLAPRRSLLSLSYADFKIHTGQPEVGHAILEVVAKSTPDFFPAWMRLAELALERGNPAECEAFLRKILDRDAGHFEGLLLQARCHMAQGAADRAVADLEQLNKAFPMVPQVVYHLGLANLMKGDLAAASARFDQVITLDPQHTEAYLTLAELRIRQGDPGSAIFLLNQLARLRPGLLRGELLLALAYRAKGQFDDAHATYQRARQQHPDNPQIPYVVGLTFEQQQRPQEARLAYESALQISPSFLPALEQIVRLDIATTNYAAALQRVQPLLSQQTNSAPLFLLLAQIQLAQRNLPAAEEAAQQALQRVPDLRPAYMLLAQIHMLGAQPDQALEKLRQVLARQPSDKAALMQAGMIHEARRQYSEAAQTYEKLLQADPKFGPALNNLAYLYVEQLDNLSRAFDLARRARESRPRDPYAADTLGWVAYKRQDYTWALSLFKESSDRLPNNPEILYHLALAYYQMNQTDPARRAFQQVLRLDPAFPHRSTIDHCLAILAVDPHRPGPQDRLLLDQALQADPSDPVALSGRAHLHEAEGAASQALQLYEQALKRNPKHVAALLGLARLSAGPTRQPAKALALARDLRSLAPNDPTLTHALGQVAFQAGDSAWALSLLQEAARKLPGDPQPSFDLAWALYSLGRLTEARDAMRSASNLHLADPARSAHARLFLAMLELHLDPAQAPRQAAQVEAALQTDPAFAPALFAAALIHEAQTNYADACRLYETILSLPNYHSFHPARRQLGFLLAEKLHDYDRAYPHLAKCREEAPNHAPIARALGLVLYHRRDYPRAATLLEESSRAQPPDPVVLFHLGLTRLRLNQPRPAAEALRQGLALEPNGPLADEARKALAQLP